MCSIFSHIRIHEGFSRKETTNADIVLRCLDGYIKVMKTRTDAILQKSCFLYKEYNREMFDLLWTEFQLWKSGYIPDKTMMSWIKIIGKKFKNEKHAFSENICYITWFEVWKELKDTEYFTVDDEFVSFIDCIFKGKTTETLRYK